MTNERSAKKAGADVVKQVMCELCNSHLRLLGRISSIVRNALSTIASFG